MNRNGGDLVVETLTTLGVDTVFGLPGQHALGLFDALRRAPIRLVASRTENNAAFAADGYARTTGRPGVLFLSTGPGALTSLAGLQEAYATSVPMVVISSQIPRAGLGGRRKGFLHQLDDQRQSVQNVTKSAVTVEHPAGIAPAIEQAWRAALTAPQGPVWVEITQDTLLEPTSLPRVADVDGAASPVPARAELLDAAAASLAAAERPVILAGGGVRRAGAEAELAAVAEALRAPVVCTPGGKGAFSWDHPLSAQSWVEDAATTELLAGADVLLVIGSSLGEVTSNYFTLRPRGQLIQIDAEPRVLESNVAALGIRSDAKLALAGLQARLTLRLADGRAEQTVANLLAQVRDRLAGQNLAHEQGVLAAIREAVPDDTVTFWDMTIAAYWAWSCWDAGTGAFHSAQGAGGIGWAYGAGLGGAVGLGRRVLVVSGDGGAMYSIGELAVAGDVVDHRRRRLRDPAGVYDPGLRGRDRNRAGPAELRCPRRCILGASTCRDAGQLGGGARGVVARGRSRRRCVAHAARDVRADPPVLSFSQASRHSPRRDRFVFWQIRSNSGESDLIGPDAPAA